jgi:hypothetical protein
MLAKALDQLDALIAQLGAHRRIDIGIATRDFVSGFFREHSQATHESAADAKNVNVHG